jgi:twitching motility two-component system response regulator PilG
MKADTIGDTPAPTLPAKQKIPAAIALQEIARKQLSGRLTIHDTKDNSIIWRIYVGNGLIHFANSVSGQQERLAYLLQRYDPQSPILPLSEFESDYQYLCHCWQSGRLSLPQVRQILFTLTQEAIIHVTTLSQAQLGFEKTIGLDPLLLSVSLKQAVSLMLNTVKQWLHLQPEIQSPFQRFFIKDLKKLTQTLQLELRQSEQLQSLVHSLNQNLCLYELSYQLNKDALDLAWFLHPLVNQGIIGTNPYCLPQEDKRPVIACIDDSKTVQRNVKFVLESSGYKVLELIEPARALTTLVRNKPALILMDISMPEIDGYDLCRMLLLSDVLKEVPIVMLTGRDGLIDRLRARMVGASGYITKPFHPQELLNTVNRFASQAVAAV